MKPVVLTLTLALMLAAPFVALSEPVPAPGIEITVDGCSPCRAGARVTATLNVDNPGPARSANVVALLRHPNGTTVYPLPGNGPALLPSGVSVIILADLVIFGGDPGVYLIEAAIVDPQTGVTLGRHVVG